MALSIIHWIARINTTGILLVVFPMIYYVSNANIPGKQAHTIQQMKMCQAFMRNGKEICFVHPSYGDLSKNVHWENISEYYGLNDEFEIRTIPSLQSRIQSIPKVQGFSMALTMTSWLASQALLGKINKGDILYGRNYYAMMFFNELRQLLPKNRQPTMVFEIHTPISTHLKQQFFKSVDYIVSITEKLKRYLINRYNVNSSKILIEPDGVDMGPYQNITKQDARERLDLRNEENIVMYTGHLYRGKGVETLIKSAKGLDATVYVVGGYDEDVQRIKTEVGIPDNVKFTGFVNPAKIPVYQLAADVLVAPYTSESRPWVSPLKLFEYMAAGKPIVASDREVLQEVLKDGENAVLFKKGDVEQLQNQVSTILRNCDLSTKLAAAATAEIERYEWTSRAGRILSIINEDPNLRGDLEK